MVEIGQKVLDVLKASTNPVPAVVLDDDAACEHVAMVYSNFVWHYAKKHIWLLTKKMKPTTRENKMHQLRKLIHIASEFGVSEEEYIRTQFQIQMKWLKKYKLKYVPFGHLISDKAIEYFKQYQQKLNRKFGRSTEQQIRQTTEVGKLLRLRDAVASSMNAFAKRLSRVGVSGEEVSSERAISELEILFHAGLVSDIYLIVCPVGDGSATLQQHRNLAVNRLTEFENRCVHNTWSQLKKNTFTSNSEWEKFL